jgi:hypothetical protein
LIQQRCGPVQLVCAPNRKLKANFYDMRWLGAYDLHMGTKGGRYRIKTITNQMKF